MLTAPTEPTIIGHRGISGAGLVGFSTRLAVPALATVLAFPALRTLATDSAENVIRVCTAGLVWIAVCLVSSVPRHGDPDVHDRQVDLIVGLPLLAAAAWQALSFPPEPSVAGGLTYRDAVAASLFLSGISFVILGTRLTMRLGRLLLLPLVAFSASLGHSGVHFLALTLAILMVIAEVWRWRRDRLPISSRSTWLRATQQHLPRLQSGLAVLAGILLMLGLGQATSGTAHPRQGPHTDAITSPGSAGQ